MPAAAVIPVADVYIEVVVVKTFVVIGLQKFDEINIYCSIVVIVYFVMVSLFTLFLMEAVGGFRIARVEVKFYDPCRTYHCESNCQGCFHQSRTRAIEDD